MDIKTVEKYFETNGNFLSLLHPSGELYAAIKRDSKIAQIIAEHLDSEEVNSSLYTFFSVSDSEDEELLSALCDANSEQAKVFYFLNIDREKIVEKIESKKFDELILLLDKWGLRRDYESRKESKKFNEYNLLLLFDPVDPLGKYDIINIMLDYGNSFFYVLHDLHKAYIWYRSLMRFVWDNGAEDSGLSFPPYVYRNLGIIELQKKGNSAEEKVKYLVNAFDCFISSLMYFHEWNSSVTLDNRFEIIDNNWCLKYIEYNLFPNDIDDVTIELLFLSCINACKLHYHPDYSDFEFDCSECFYPKGGKSCKSDFVSFKNGYDYYCEGLLDQPIDKIEEEKIPFFAYLYDDVKKSIIEKAEKGMVSYQCLLGDLYRNGMAGMEKDEEQAKVWYNKVISENKNEECVEYAKNALAKMK